MLISPMAFQLKITKDRIKFSAAHFTIFSKTEAERLHGHNYYLSVTIQTDEVDELGFSVSMDVIKKASFDISQELDEFVLIPTQNPYLQVQEKGNQVEVVWNEKHYSFPQQDVRLLELSNITCENLAYWFWQRLVGLLPSAVTFLEVAVCETSGQEAIYAKKAVKS